LPWPSQDRVKNVRQRRDPIGCQKVACARNDTWGSVKKASKAIRVSRRDVRVIVRSHDDDRGDVLSYPGQVLHTVANELVEDRQYWQLVDEPRDEYERPDPPRAG